MLQTRTFHVSVAPRPGRLALRREAEVQASTLAELIERSPGNFTLIANQLELNVKTFKKNLTNPGQLRLDEIVTLAEVLGVNEKQLFDFIRAEVHAQREAEKARLAAEEKGGDTNGKQQQPDKAA